MSPAPPLSKKDAALLATYSGLQGAEAIAFFEKHRDALITASLAAAHAADDGSNNTPPAAFPPLPPAPATPSASTPKAPLIGKLQVRLSLVRESSGHAVAVDVDYGVSSPVRVMTIDPAAIKEGWQQGFVLNLELPEIRMAAKGQPGVPVLPPKAPAATSLPSKLRRLLSRKTK
jgi:hypothetical protein